jgi:hypothetical protein
LLTFATAPTSALPVPVTDGSSGSPPTNAQPVPLPCLTSHEARPVARAPFSELNLGSSSAASADPRLSTAEGDGNTLSLAQSEQQVQYHERHDFIDPHRHNERGTDDGHTVRESIRSPTGNTEEDQAGTVKRRKLSPRCWPETSTPVVAEGQEEGQARSTNERRGRYVQAGTGRVYPRLRHQGCTCSLNTLTLAFDTAPLAHSSTRI